MELSITNWEVMQDVHDLGYKLKIYSNQLDMYSYSHLLSPFQPIYRLTYLQKIFSEQPYYGRSLRQFNNAPWWYRTAFHVNISEDSNCILHFDMIDYYADIWVNGIFCGHHEGYQEAVEIDVSGVIRNGENTIYVRVDSPWDTDLLEGYEEKRFFSVQRRMVKGTYEHADGFIQRDVNPIGIVGNVFLKSWNGGRIVRAGFRGEASGDVYIHIENENITKGDKLEVSIYDSDGVCVRKLETDAENTVCLKEHIENPSLWWTWDKGTQGEYFACVELISSEGEVLDSQRISFGFCTKAIIREPEKTEYILNGKRIFLRGTVYFPDVYFADLPENRLRRDLLLIRQAGFNAVRVHVHIEKDAFYSLCDEFGLLVFQDTDFSWCHPIEETWINQAVGLFSRILVHLRNHPSIGCWILLNEPDKWKTSLMKEGGYSLAEIISRQDSISRKLGIPLRDAIQKLAPECPYIRASYNEDDMESGDSHNYLGSLRGETTEYTQIRGTKEKLVTEFGMDVPGCVENLSLDQNIYKALSPASDSLPKMQQYQYKLLKFYIEHYRAQKYKPCSGYFQFMFIDLCPQSFYGVLDYWATPKMGWSALEESNQPLAIMAILPETGASKNAEIIIANDTDNAYTGTVSWHLVYGDKVIASDHFAASIGPDDVAVCGSLPEIRVLEGMELFVHYRDERNHIIGKNHYRSPFIEMNHIPGHPNVINSELGMRLYRRE